MKVSALLLLLLASSSLPSLPARWPSEQLQQPPARHSYAVQLELVYLPYPIAAACCCPPQLSAGGYLASLSDEELRSEAAATRAQMESFRAELLTYRIAMVTEAARIVTNVMLR